jgi:oxygen-dependent protoporphyrinogen oxidase
MRVAVVGGGVTGLSAARRITELDPHVEVTLFEAAPTLGGKIRTTASLGGSIEEGADSLLIRNEGTRRLLQEIGLEEAIRAPAIFAGAIWDGSGSKGFPKGAVMGIPTSAWATWKAGTVGPRATLRIAAESLHRQRLEGPDIAVADFVTERFGAEVLDEMVDPILAGTRAGDPRTMSLAAAMPQIDTMARAHRSLTRGLRRAASRGAAGPPRFVSFSGGMGRLIDALAADGSSHGVQICTGAPIAAIGRASEGLILQPDGDAEPFSAVILCVPAPQAAALLGGISPTAAAGLGSIRHASAATVMLRFDEAHVPEIPGSGILVPSRRAGTISALTWFSKKWPGSAPTGSAFVRCFVGRAERHPTLDRPDQMLVEAIVRDLHRITGIAHEPLGAHVTRWEDALPSYEIGHLERVAEIEKALVPHRIFVAGADLRGAGIPDCIAQGEAAAEASLEVQGPR